MEICGRGFVYFATYRRFVDEAVGRRNARNRKRIEIERPALKGLPERRTTDMRTPLAVRQTAALCCGACSTAFPRV